MTTIETYLRYQDIFGTASTLGQFEDVMRSLEIGLVLRLFAPAIQSVLEMDYQIVMLRRLGSCGRYLIPLQSNS
jgi:hypothetical protein